MKIVVATCDKYLWLTPIFMHFYRKNWPDNPYHTQFVTETEQVKEMDTFCAGKLPWADRMAAYLEHTDDELFLLLVEDYIIREKVNTVVMRRAASICAGDIGCVRLQPHDHQSTHLIPADIDGFMQYPLDKPYAVSLQAAIWQKSFFLEFLRRGENVWQTETEGSKRIRTSKKCVMWTDTPAIDYHPCGFMQKGKIVKPVEQWVKENW